MLKINISDVAKVLSSCIPQIVAFVLVLLLAIIISVLVRKKEDHIKKIVRAESILAVFLALVLVANLISFGPMSTLLTLATGEGTIEQSTLETAKSLSQEIVEEGVVLLENKDQNLPYQSDMKLNVFGWASTNPCYGGTGSGGLNDTYETVTLLQGLEDAGFSLNTALSDFYTQYRSDRPDVGMFAQDWTLPEPPVDQYSQSMLDEAKAFSNNALVVISRVGGEGSDTPTDMAAVIDGTWNDGSTYQAGSYTNNSSEYADFKAGDHYLQLSQSEKNMIELVCQNFNQVTLVYNGANAMELGWVNDYPQIKSLVWCPGAGQAGFTGLGHVLNGEVNPSGKTTDTFVADLTQSPTWHNFGSFLYDNMSEFNSVFSFMGMTISDVLPSFINYTDGIYVGYRYYETAAQEGAIDYDQSVVYPFGYGLSYTKFSQKMGPMTENNGQISFDVTVTNTGDVSGKEVVEVYYNPPYTNGGIEKSSANLIAFDKTDKLEPGESQVIPITFDIESMASYDGHTEKAYVLESGDYIISINKNAHELIDSQTYSLGHTIVYDEENPRQSDQTAATNHFDYASGDLTYLSRADHFANFDEATAGPQTLSMPENQKSEFLTTANYDPKSEDDPNAIMPTTEAKNGVKLYQLRGLSYDDPLWESLLDELSVDDMDLMISTAGYQTQKIDSVGKLATIDCDGPASINNNFTGVGSLGFPCAVLIASTWNKTLAYDFGDSIGTMADQMGVSGWYAPAMNTHRSAFAGRNFEYYSEDGLLAGNMAANAVKGAKAHGVYAYVKHFALNDQESRRSDMLCTWADEQAIREVYLKPFEIAIKEGGAGAVMTAFNYIGPVYAACTDELLKDVLRSEWGFRGMVITDGFSGYGFQNADQVVRAGNDACLVAYDTPETHVHERSASGVIAMRDSAHNIMYTVVNSRAYENGGKENPARWMYILWTIDILFALICVAFEFIIIRRYKHRKQ